MKREVIKRFVVEVLEISLVSLIMFFIPSVMAYIILNTL